MQNKTSPGNYKKVTSPSNPIIKAIKALHMKKVRDREHLFIAEGLKLVTDAIDQGWQLQTLIFADPDHAGGIAAKAKALGADILEVSNKILSALSRKDNPQMVIGVFHQSLFDMDSIKPDSEDLWVALDRVRDPGNLGTIIRTVDAVGATGVVLVGETTDPWSLEAVRATMGSIFNIKLARTDIEGLIGWKTRGNLRMVGTHLQGACDYRTIDYGKGASILLMGNEQQGLGEQLAAACDELALIPQMGKADSLNLAVATGVMLFEMKRNSLRMPEVK